MAERIEVEGLAFDYEPERLKGWKTFQLMSRSREAQDEYARVEAVVDIVCYIAGLTVEEFIDKCGGEDTSVETVIRIASEFITGVYPKN